MWEVRDRKERREHTRRLYKQAGILVYSTEFPKTSNPYNFATHLVDVGFGGVCVLSVGKMRAGVKMIVDIQFQQHGGRLLCPATVQWSKEVDYKGRQLHMTGLRYNLKPELTGNAYNAIKGMEIVQRESPRVSDRGGRERRKSRRARVHASEVVCSPGGLMASLGLGRNVAKTLLDLSRTGAQLATSKSMMPGDRVRIRINIPRLGDIVSAVATVRWCVGDARAGTPRFAVGVTFDKVSGKSEKLLSGLAFWFDSKMGD